MKKNPSSPTTLRREGPFTLTADVGGTGLKACVLDKTGLMVTERVRVETPYPFTPRLMVKTLRGMASSFPPVDRVSVGFPGVVREGKVITAPHFGNRIWYGFPLAQALEAEWGKPVRLLNDADLQGAAVVQGQGLELVVTLGTGVGTALFRNGELMPHLELAQHPAWGDKTYNEYIGDKVLKKKGKKKWNKRVGHALDLLGTLFNYDLLYIGGGNSRLVTLKLPKNVKLVSNDAGLLGGIRLWDGSIRV